MNEHDIGGLAHALVAWLPLWVVLVLAAAASIGAVFWSALGALMRRMRNVWTG